MTITLIGTTVSALAVEAGKFALFTHPGLPGNSASQSIDAVLPPVLHLSVF